MGGGGAGDGDLRVGSLCRGRGHSRSTAYSRDSLCELLFEKVLEGLARVVVARRGRRGGRGSLVRVGGGSGVFLDSGAKLIKFAGVLSVLGRDALGDRLRAFKLRAAIEEATLFAAVQLEGALGTLAVGVETVGEHRTTIGAARARHGADHARRARTELIGARTALRRLAVVRAVLLLLLFRVAITAVIILSIHKCLLQHADNAERLAGWAC